MASQEEICLHLPQQQVWKQEIECDNVVFLSGRVKADNTAIKLERRFKWKHSNTQQ